MYQTCASLSLGGLAVFWLGWGQVFFSPCLKELFLDSALLFLADAPPTPCLLIDMSEAGKRVNLLDSSCLRESVFRWNKGSLLEVWAIPGPPTGVPLYLMPTPSKAMRSQNSLLIRLHIPFFFLKNILIFFSNFVQFAPIFLFLGDTSFYGMKLRFFSWFQGSWVLCCHFYIFVNFSKSGGKEFLWAWQLHYQLCQTSLRL